MRMNHHHYHHTSPHYNLLLSRHRPLLPQKRNLHRQPILAPSPFLQWLVLFTAIMTMVSSSSHALSSPASVAVIGATGKLGRWVVQELVDQGIPCRLLVRKMPMSGTTTDSSTTSDKRVNSVAACGGDTSGEDLLVYFQSLPQVSLVAGDVNDVDALKKLVDGEGDDCRACLAVWGATRRSKFSDLWNQKLVQDTDPTHSKQVNYQGVLNLIHACQTSKSCKRIVRITGKGEDPTSFFSILINMLGSMAKAWNYQGEQALRLASNNGIIEYTIIRPGVMSNDAPKSGNTKLVLADNGGDLPVARIRYQDIAKLCVESLDYPNAVNCTLTAMTTKDDDTRSSSTSSITTTASSSSWGPLLAQVRPDRRSFPSDMLEQHYAAVRNVIWKIGGVIAAMVATILYQIFVV